jgi:hypothetical protein
MGLDCSHDAFHGAYSAFNSLRQEVSRVTGGSFPPHWLYNADGTLAKGNDGLAIYDRTLNRKMIYLGDGVGPEETPGLYEFLTHSDCDGKISPEMCVKVADDLEKVLPKIEAKNTPSHGHIAARGGYAEVVRKFIVGCRAAAKAGEPLIFG